MLACHRHGVLERVPLDVSGRLGQQQVGTGFDELRQLAQDAVRIGYLVQNGKRQREIQVIILSRLFSRLSEALGR